jgi:hypothetical protein
VGVRRGGRSFLLVRRQKLTRSSRARLVEHAECVSLVWPMARSPEQIRAPAIDCGAAKTPPGLGHDCFGRCPSGDADQADFEACRKTAGDVDTPLRARICSGMSP